MGCSATVGFVASRGEFKAEVDIVLTGESLTAKDEVTANETGEVPHAVVDGGGRSVLCNESYVGSAGRVRFEIFDGGVGGFDPSGVREEVC